MKLFETIFYKHLNETNMSGAGGVFGDTGSMGFGGAVTPATDFYAPGDNRIPKGGAKKGSGFKPCDHCKTKSKCRKAGKCLGQNMKEKNGSIQPLIPMQRRPLSNTM